MSATISKVSVNPSNVVSGNNPATLTYDACVDALADNMVDFVLYVEPNSSLFLLGPGGANVNSITWTKQLTTNWVTYTQQITLVGILTPAQAKAVSIRLEATDTHGNKSVKNTFVIYQ